MGAVSYEVCAQRLSDISIDAKVKVVIIGELKDTLDFSQIQDTSGYLALLIPAFSSILENVSPAFYASAPEHKLRNSVLEIIHRIPTNEALREFVPNLMSSFVHLLKVDNEENAVICLKIIVEFHKIYKAALEDYVQPFFDIVQDMYKNMDAAVQEAFDVPLLSQSTDRPSSPSADQSENAASKTSTTKPLQKSVMSFKVLTECPIIIALLFQLHRKYVQSNVTIFVPLIIKVLALQPKLQKEAHAHAEAAGIIFVGVSPKITNRTAYAELKALQVKTVSFIAYILRSFFSLLRHNMNEIAESVVTLMKDCPPEASATRKELLVATRHIWYTDFRQGFIPYIDILLNEDVLIGTGVTSRETLRPLGHSVLVDLIHHIRSDLSLAQSSRVIDIYSRNLHDHSFPHNIPTMCAKLLLNLIETLINKLPKQDVRPLLIKILNAFIWKFGSLKMEFPVIQQYCARKKIEAVGAQPPSEATDPLLDGYLDLPYIQPIRTSTRPYESSQDIVQDVRMLIRILIQGVKTILQKLRTYPPTAPASDSDKLMPTYLDEEVGLFITLFRDGLQCFEYYTLVHPGSDDTSNKAAEPRPASSTPSKEEKDGLDNFSFIFTSLDPPIFQEVLSHNMDFLFEQLATHNSWLSVPQYFLANQAVSPNFAGFLLRFLVDRIEMLGEPDASSAVMLRLFKLLFMAVTLFPEKNEQVLRPHLSHIIMSSMKLSSKAKDSQNYFLLLRSLFRSIGGGRFEVLYQEVFPLLQVLLEGLNNLFATAHKQSMKELFVELCLTVPVRLSVLLPYLSYLMKPLVFALQAGPELVSQGLRTLELCIDNLTQEFLEPLMSPVLNDLMAALWKHLQPPPYPQIHSHTTMRILGKLGGRNRRKLLAPNPFTFNRVNPETGLEMEIKFASVDNSVRLALDGTLDHVFKIATDPSENVTRKRQAFLFAKASLALLLDTSVDQRGFGQLLHNQCSQIQEQATTRMDIDSEPPVKPPGQAETHALFADPLPYSCEKKIAQDGALNLVMTAMFAVSTVEDIKNESWPCVEACCRHFAFLCIGEMLKDYQTEGGSQTSVTLDILLSMPSSKINGFIDAIVDVIASEDEDRRLLGKAAVMLFYETCVQICGDKALVHRMPLFHILAGRFCSCCYEEAWFKKSGGCFGISILTSILEFGPRWMLDHELDFVKALLYVLKDTSAEMSTGNVEEARQVLSHVLKVCNRPEKSDALDRSSKFNNLVSLLISELSSSNAAVRETIQSALQLLGDLTGSEVTDLLSPVRERLLNPIFAKPLRALPVSMQIGHIDAITYCLSLKPPLLNFSDELLRLLQEVLALADAEDQALAGKSSSQFKSATSLVNLRVVCIKLLSSAMSCNDFPPPRHYSIRGRITSVFFKSLYSKSPEVVEVANKGLQQVLAQQHRLPKDLLQAGLRPILVNLADHTRLTVSGLAGLARLLELLTNYFKTEIGKKLLDHLRNWADPNVLQEASAKPLSEVNEIKIIVGILDVFCLLPATANVFMDDLVKQVLDLERKLHRLHSSPFRLPLIRFLNRYASEALGYFLDRLSDPQYARLFIHLVATDAATVLRLELMKSVDRLLLAFGEPTALASTAKLIDSGAPEVGISQLVPSGGGGSSAEATDAVPKTEETQEIVQAHGVAILFELCRHDPDWVVQNPSVLTFLKKLWRATATQRKPLATNSTAAARRNQLIQHLLWTFMKVYAQEPSEIELLFNMVEGFRLPELVDSSFLLRFFYQDVAMPMTGKQMRRILEAFLTLYQDPAVGHDTKTLIMKLIITPALTVVFSKKEHKDAIDIAIIELVHNCFWQPGAIEASAEANHHGSELLKIELLQFTTLLVQHVPDIISETRRDVIKFAWHHIKEEDVTCKQATYVLMAYFIREYETPPKIVTQTFVALLKAHQTEGRALVKQALDVLVPVLPKRMPPANESEARNPTWVRWMRKLIIEEGHTTSQLITIYQLLVRHADLFYECRNSFIPHIIASLSKLGLSSGAVTDLRGISLELIELILTWENRFYAEKAANIMAVDTCRAATEATQSASHPPDEMDVDVEPGHENAERHDPDGGLDSTYKEMIVTFVLRFASSLNEPPQKKDMFHRASDILKRFLGIWQTADVKLSVLEKALSLEQTESNLQSLCRTLDLISIVVSHRSSQWSLANVAHLHKCIETCLGNENHRAVKCLTALLETTCKVLAQCEQGSPELVMFWRLLDQYAFSLVMESPSSVKPSVAHVIDAIYRHRADKLDPMMEESVRLLGHYAKELISPSPPAQPPTPTPTPTPTPAPVVAPGSTPASAPTSAPAAQSATQPSTASPGPDTLVPAIIALLGVLKIRISHMNDHRKTFLASVTLLIESVTDPELLRSLLAIVRGWLYSEEPFPTAKEKSNLLLKLMVLEKHSEKSLFKSYLELVADIYSAPAFARTEITMRLEKAFLIGTRYEDSTLRTRFLDILHQHVQPNLLDRLKYIFATQNWEPLSGEFWLQQALDLLLRTVRQNETLYHCYSGYRIASISHYLTLESGSTHSMSMVQDQIEQLQSSHMGFLAEVQKQDVAQLIKSMCQLLVHDVALAARMWTTMFPLLWSVLDPAERHELSKALIMLLAKDFHSRQMDARPNVVMVLLEGMCGCVPSVQLPSQLIAHLGKTFNAWYPALELLSQQVTEIRDLSPLSAKDDDKIRESTLDALTNLFESLGEEDYYAGLWRRRCVYLETNMAISYKQCGLWAHAQAALETVQSKARAGSLHFSESEYLLWEDEWISCAKKLQQWEMLLELAKLNTDTDLMFECAWRLSDWSVEREQYQMALSQAMEPPSPRKKIYEAFLLIPMVAEGKERMEEFHRHVEEGIHLALRQWVRLPEAVSDSHIPLLHTFQQLVELQEAATIQVNLSQTNASNIDAKFMEIKSTLQTWRERLPNLWDNIDIWSDLVAWRQHIFSMINKAYMPLIPQMSQNSATSTNANAYRGYHETAWIINRFAHVARKHQLTDVCINALNKIYTLPNIEIQEAFYKLREQAKCYFLSPSDYPTGLDVINNTNLMYFSNQQKTEFFSLKAIFSSKLKHHDEAVASFSHSVTIDSSHAKSWAAFGQYHDQLFKEHPEDIKHGESAIAAYLQAASTFNSSRSRKYLARILWLLNLDDAQQTLSKAYDNFKGDIPLWYWITFIPQLLTSLSNKEADHAKQILLKIAKSYPQALHFQLRTTKEDFMIIKKQSSASATSSLPGSRPPETPAAIVDPTATPSSINPGEDSGVAAATSATTTATASSTPGQATSVRKLQPWEHVEEIMNLLKTTSPLLALSMETMVDQILQRLKPTTDEDIYRLIVALLTDGIQQLARDPADTGPLSAATEVNLNRFADSMVPNHVKYKPAFERDFISSKPNLYTLVERFRDWRDRLEVLLDCRPGKQHLEHFSHYLVEFEYQKFDDIEVPGQYFLLRDNNKDFVRIDRFHPEVDIIRRHGNCHRRLTIRGHDGSYNPFSVQHPAPRQCRREERIVQLFRILNSVVERKQETRKRNLHFHLPLIVPLAPQVRLVQDDPSYISLYEVYEHHCAKTGTHKDEPVKLYMDRMRSALTTPEFAKRPKSEILSLKMEIMEEVARKLIPDTILSRFMMNTMSSYSELWAFRKKFTQQLGSVSLMTHLLNVTHRTPQKMYISLNSGNILSTELISGMSNITFLYSSNETVPFRLTPNLVKFVTPVGVEGIFTNSMMSMARSLIEPEVELEDYLAIFVRDELVTWHTASKKPPPQEHHLRDLVSVNMELIVKKAQAMSCKTEREKGIESGAPANQTVLDLISVAVNPMKLAGMDVGFMSQL
ncbi:uncharacterized protein BJ171DRAFT_609195 [Polychytrium aggregatum]|uniref:uncharacterized protein n=1 Tax=Polychytrium aggregatum TaxID=110093 RepID=UPI0022FE6140|nr:uncharacterized protein BJ171DRAFT_609195 [Polychytrium aggregatum]KAI9209824.1 hypothetical protein BJ171DRAFT_609195 [Polychytrium aggregatum]